MGKERVAVVGIGQTHHQATRGDVSIAGLVREAAVEALDDAGMTWADIDAVVVGKAPDFFEGVMMPELYLADALGCVGKPLLRVHTAGSVGGSPPLVAGAGGYFAPHIRAYMRRSSAPDHIGVLVALKDRQNALKNPYAHLHEHDITFEKVRDSIMLWDPVRYSETCPSSDGACAMILTDEAGGDEAAGAGRRPAWMLGGAMRSEPTMFPGRDLVNPRAGRGCAAGAYGGARIPEPRAALAVAGV